MEATTETQPVDLDRAISYVARKAVKRFLRWVREEDMRQELHLFVLDQGRRVIQRAVDKDDNSKVLRILFGHARMHGEAEKAAHSGYDVGDVAWYSPEKLSTLIPLALDPCWDGIEGESADVNSGYGNVDPHEGGNLLVMVVDVRRALGSAVDWATEQDFDPETDEGWQRLLVLADRLGGEFPNSPGYQRGRRRAISNATAAAITHSNEQGDS